MIKVRRVTAINSGQPNSITNDQPTGLSVMPNLARLAVVLGLAAAYRVWELRRVADENGQGRTTVNALLSACEHYQTGLTRRALLAILRKYDGIFWNYNGQKQMVNYAGHGQRNVAVRLLNMAIDQLPKDAHLQLTNKPGTVDRVVLDMSGSIGQFKANIYAVWLTVGVKISRVRLARLFNVTAQQTRNWENITGVVNVALDYHVVDRDDVAQAANPSQIFPHDHYYETKDGYVYQGVNTYTTSLRHAPTQGQRRHVKAAVNNAIDLNPDKNPRVGEKRYFDSEKDYLRHVKKHGDNGRASVFKTWQWATNRYSGQRVRINRYSRRVIVLSTKNLTPVSRSVIYTLNGSQQPKAIHVLKPHLDQIPHTQPLAPTHAPVHLSPVTHDQPAPETDSSQSAMQSPRGIVAICEPETVTRDRRTVKPSHRAEDPTTQRRKPSHRASSNHTADSGHTIATLTQTRLRVLRGGAVLWQPETVTTGVLPEGVMIVQHAGETWHCVENVGNFEICALIAICPDLTKSLYATAVNRCRSNMRVKSCRSNNSRLNGVQSA